MTISAWIRTTWFMNEPLWRLPLAERVLLVAVYYRTDLTVRQLAPLLGVSPATVCRVIQRLGPLLALEPACAGADATDRLRIVDGTLIPVRDRKVGASSRNYRFSANVQVIVDAESRMVVAAARPVPGNTADAKAWRSSGLAPHCEGVTVVGDGAYINTGLIVPQRKRPGRRLLKGDRQRCDGLHHAVQAVARMCTTSPSSHDRTGSSTASACVITGWVSAVPAPDKVHLRGVGRRSCLFGSLTGGLRRCCSGGTRRP